MLKHCSGVLRRTAGLVPIVDARQFSRGTVAAMARAAKAEPVNGTESPAVEAKVRIYTKESNLYFS